MAKITVKGNNIYLGKCMVGYVEKYFLGGWDAIIFNKPLCVKYGKYKGYVWNFKIKKEAQEAIIKAVKEWLIKAGF